MVHLTHFHTGTV